jgi:Holliday junction resolvase RusA-like endonuclease
MNIELNIKGLPDLPNKIDGRHWKTRWYHNVKWKKKVTEALVGNIPMKPFTRARIECIRFTSKQPDFDNLAKSFKPILDALVENRIIIDDNPNVIGAPTYTWTRGTPGDGCIKIKIEQVF